MQEKVWVLLSARAKLVLAQRPIAERTAPQSRGRIPAFRLRHNPRTIRIGTNPQPRNEPHTRRRASVTWPSRPSQLPYGLGNGALPMRSRRDPKIILAAIIVKAVLDSGAVRKKNVAQSS